jgi:nucleotide-binding universal stress UspA family protein
MYNTILVPLDGSKRAEAILAHVEQLAHRFGASVVLLQVIEPVVNTIIEAAKSEEADLIALASHGRTGLSRVYYGSVAAGVLHRVDRPLLLVRSRDGE